MQRRESSLPVCDGNCPETKPLPSLDEAYDIDQKLLEYEHHLIKQALAQSDGKVTHAAKLIDKTYQLLAKMIETKHLDLIPTRTSVRRRSPGKDKQSKHR
jgi:transcriptional regulator with PAS, ATPase and Fis domain